MFSKEEIMELNYVICREHREYQRRNGVHRKGAIKSTVDNINLKYLLQYNLTEEEKNKMALYFSEKRPAMFIKCLEIGFIDDKTLSNIMDVNPGVFKILTVKMYEENEKYFNLLLEKVTDEIFIKLPKKIQDLPGLTELVTKRASIYKNNGYDNTGYDVNWLDKDGNLREYIKLFGDFPINSKEDYLAIVDMFVNSEMNILQFCSFYGIDDKNGFRKLLDRLKIEDDNQKLAIQNHNNNSINKYFAGIEKIVNSIKKDDFSFDTYFKTSYSINHNFSDFLNKLDDNNKVKLVNYFIDYVKNNEFALPIDRIMTLFNTNEQNIGKSVFFQLVKYTNGSKREDLISIRNIIDSYSISYNRNTYKNNTYRLKDGNEYHVTDESIDEALAYMDDHNISRCAKTASYYIRQTTLGILSYKSETNDNKDELKQILSEFAKEELTIKDYFEIMDKHSNKKRCN